MGTRDDAGNNIVLKPKCLESIIMFVVALGTPKLGLKISEGEVCVRSISLSTYTSIASKRKPRGNEILEEGLEEDFLE